MSEVCCFRSLFGVLFDVVDVVKEGPLNVPRRRFRFKQTTAGIVSAKTSQQILLGEEFLVFPDRKHTGLAMKLFNWRHQEASRNSPECSILTCLKLLRLRAIISVRGHGNSLWWLGEFQNVEIKKLQGEHGNDKFITVAPLFIFSF